jgi:hypothetical protein
MLGTGRVVVDGGRWRRRRRHLIRRSANLIDHLNGPFAAFINLPLDNGRSWHLSTHQGRKTFARFVGRRDRTGLHALAAHFGHVTRIMTDASYVGTDFDLANLIDAEALDETRAALEELLAATRPPAILFGTPGRRVVSSQHRPREGPALPAGLPVRLHVFGHSYLRLKGTLLATGWQAHSVIGQDTSESLR